MKKGTKTATLQARVCPDIHESVQRLADAWKLKPSDIVRIAIEHYVAVNSSRPNPLIGSTGVDPFEVALKMNEAAASSAAPSPASPTERTFEDIARTFESTKRKPRTGS